MKEIARQAYLDRIIEGRENSLIKVITGIRRCGKSYLLDPMYIDYLKSTGVDNDHIIKVDLESRENKHLRNPDVLNEYVKSKIVDDKIYYCILDEIQMVEDFESVLNGFLHVRNLDVYVTGSNSKFLSKDIITEFRGRSHEIRIFPLSFAEFMSVYEGDVEAGWEEYYTYGGLPLVLGMKTDASKMDYLEIVRKNIYTRDIVERYNIKNDSDLLTIIKVISSSDGSYTNPTRLENTFKSVLKINISHNTISDYLEKLSEAYLIESADRFDVLGNKYIGTPKKYYFEDIGLRNSFLGFRQQDEGHIMENLVYLELLRRGYRVDIGVVEVRDEETKRVNLEVDFVANKGNDRIYIQSAYTTSAKATEDRENNSLKNIKDSFKKIIITHDRIKRKRDEQGIVTMNLFDFLLDDKSLDY